MTLMMMPPSYRRCKPGMRRTHLTTPLAIQRVPYHHPRPTPFPHIATSGMGPAHLPQPPTMGGTPPTSDPVEQLGETTGALVQPAPHLPSPPTPDPPELPAARTWHETPPGPPNMAPHASSSVHTETPPSSNSVTHPTRVRSPTPPSDQQTIPSHQHLAP
jgi:hypothetical protein